MDLLRLHLNATKGGPNVPVEAIRTSAMDASARGSDVEIQGTETE